MFALRMLAPLAVPVLLFGCWAFNNLNTHYKQLLEEKDQKIQALTSANMRKNQKILALSTTQMHLLQYINTFTVEYRNQMADVMQENQDLRAQVRVLEIALDGARTNDTLEAPRFIM